MNYVSRIVKESELPEFPGVRFTLNRMSEGRRIKLRLKLAEAVAEMRELVAEGAAIEQQPAETRDLRRLTGIVDGIRAIKAEKINPVWVRWGLSVIEGLEIDGAPATVDTLIEDGPPELYAEILKAIQTEAGLTDAQQGESEPPTTSGESVDGGMSDTTAENVASSGTSQPGTAENTSPKK